MPALPSSNRLGFLLARIPLKTMMIVIFFCFIVVEYPPLSLRFGLAEFYPLSSFPMYSTFSPAPRYVYLTDGVDEPIACWPAFAVRTSVIKKYYEDRLQETKKEIDVPTYRMTPAQKTPAGEKTLAHLVENLAPDAFSGGALPHIRLYEVTITRGDSGAIDQKTVLVGELRRDA
ncbi:MAG: hypothetical protein ACC661_06280 [Verrucomicrobiales bacterium]